MFFSTRLVTLALSVFFQKNPEKVLEFSLLTLMEQYFVFEHLSELQNGEVIIVNGKGVRVKDAKTFYSSQNATMILHFKSFIQNKYSKEYMFYLINVILISIHEYKLIFILT